MSPKAQLALLFRDAQRASSEVVGAAKLFAHLRGATGFSEYVKALEFLSELEAAAAKAKAAWQAAGPVEPMTTDQRQAIVRLLNDVRISSREKHTGLLNLPMLTMVGAADTIQALKRSINASAGYVVYPEVAEYAVVGEAFAVQVEQQAA